ncbi:hypothetical protein L9H89_003950 [Klebsiella aerogenes]|nr:hypothetical protein [Klebsiella aerogenes]
MKCLLWSTPVAASRQLAAVGEMSTVVDAGGGVPAAGRSRGNVYCGRRRWRRPGSWPQQGKCLLWSTPVAASRQLAAAGEMSTVVDAGGGVRAAGRSRGKCLL